MSLMSLFGLCLAVGVAGCAAAPPPQASEAAAPLRVDYVAPLTPQPSASNKAVVFYDDFDQQTDLHARYFEYGDENGSFVWNPGAGYGGHGGAMQCRFEKGQVSAGSLKVVFGKNPFGKGPRSKETFREIYWRVYVRHEPGWEGNPAKLARATCLAGADWSQGFIAHVWGGKGDALCIDPATGITDSRKVTTRYNDFDHLRWLGLRESQTPIFSPSESGRWVCVESHIRLNTPGRSDGVFELWIDGHLEAARTDLDWQGTWDDYAINAVFLENYWNQGSVKRQTRWFDDFVISTRPIGPIVTNTHPTLTRTAAEVGAWEAQVAADAEGKDIVWTSRPVDGAERNLAIEAATGAFQGSRAGKRALAPGVTHWLRLRQRAASGAWSPWTAWHAPFRTAG
ncbi:MAG TPA: hypothetical protein VFB21_07020 [Chthonomonadaceae bacterium]|nr:hypothetical protein [Chthonomonadaceae bacterium]